MPKTYFFRDRPIFGITINRDSVQAMQISRKNNQLTIEGYGTTTFDPALIKDGVISDPGAMAKTIRLMLDNALQGDISTDRLALCIPSARTFSRAVTMPKLPEPELREAILLETEQYTPVAIDNLYVDYTPIAKEGDQTELLTVAATKQVVDSYLEVAKLLDLELVLIETRADSMRRLFSMTKLGGIPSVIIDFDQDTVDISIVDNFIIATGTVHIGTDFNNLISKALVDKKNMIQKEDNPADQQIDDQLTQFMKEIRRMVRYYEERYDKTRQIDQIVLVGDEARIPSLAALMTDQLRLPVRSADFWQLFKYAHDVAPLPVRSAGSYTAVAGLASVKPGEIFA